MDKLQLKKQTKKLSKELRKRALLVETFQNLMNDYMYGEISTEGLIEQFEEMNAELETQDFDNDSQEQMVSIPPLDPSAYIIALTAIIRSDNDPEEWSDEALMREILEKGFNLETTKIVEGRKK